MKESNKQRSKRHDYQLPKEVSYAPYQDKSSSDGRPSSLFLWIALATAVLYVAVL